jgi:hypothetical protein
VYSRASSVSVSLIHGRRSRERREKNSPGEKSYLLSSPSRSAGASREEQSPANSSTLITDVGTVRFSALLSRRTGRARGHRRSGSAARDARCICGCNPVASGLHCSVRAGSQKLAREELARFATRNAKRAAKERCSFPADTLHPRVPLILAVPVF